MFKRHHPHRSTLQIDTLIGAGTCIVGDVQVKGGLHVDGSIRGNVGSLPDTKASVSISDGGLIEGTVKAAYVILNGTVYGDIYADERIELGATANVSGNVYYAMIEMAMGAQINGKLIHHPSGAPLLVDGAATDSRSVALPAAEMGYTDATA